MPFKYVRKSNYSSWSIDAMGEAVRKVRKGEMSIRSAAEEYGVPKSTLARKVAAGGDGNLTAKFGRKSCLGDAVELQLEEHVLEMESRGFGLARQDVRVLAYEFAERNAIPNDFNQETKQAGRFWLEGFLKRHPRIAMDGRGQMVGVKELQQALGEDSPQFSARCELHTCSSESRLGDQDDEKSEESMAVKTEDSVSQGTNESRPKTLKKDVCAAFGCSHQRSQTLCTLHSFPRDSEINEKWIEASRCNLRKDGKTKKNFSSRNLRLCGCHFARKPHPRSSVPRLKTIVPTLFNFPSDDLKTYIKPAKRIPSMSPKPHEKLTPSKMTSHPDFYQRMKHILSKEAYDGVNSCAPGFWNNYQQLKKEVMMLRAICSSPQVLSLQNIQGNDSVFETYTGLPNYATFEVLCGYLALNAMSLQHTRAGIAFGELKITDTTDVKRQTWTTEDQLFLFLVGVRTGSSNKDLAIRFSINEALVNIIISSWAVFLSETLDEFYTTMAPAATAPSGRQNTTKDAKINVAVDYTALFSQSPVLLTTQKDETNNNRRLIAVGFSNTGVVTSVLSTLRGHAFARVSTYNKSKDSASIQPPSKGHAVPEQGTPIGTKLTKPVSVSTDLSKSHVTLMSTQEVFHVERALNRIKQFRYLQQQVEPSLVETYERVFKACAYLINFQGIS